MSDTPGRPTRLLPSLRGRALPVLLGLLLAVAAPVAGLSLLPPAAPGSRMPAAPPKPFDLVDPAAELVIIGNSKVGTDFDLARLRTELGEPGLDVRTVSIGSATMPIYYLVVKNCVIGNGARPRAIVVYLTPVELLTADLTADRRARLLVTHMVADEPVIARKLYGRAAGFDALRERAVDARDRTLNAASARVAGLLSGQEGRAALDAAFDQVFGVAWARRQKGVGTGVAGGLPSESVIAQHVEDAFVMETWEVARAAGVPLFYALAPVSGEVREREERRMQGNEALLAGALAQSDGWFRLPQPPDEGFGDREHLNQAGALENTVAFAAGLEKLGF